MIPLRPLLEAAEKHTYAQGAFNINAACQIRAAMEIHALFRSPVLLQGADLANGFMGGRTDFMNSSLDDKKRGAARIAGLVRQYSEKYVVPVALHLDHGKDFNGVKAAVDGGYTSVMIDGSALPFQENLDLTREVVKYAHPLGVTVEGELGVLAGVEDDVFSRRSAYTNPLDAVGFIRKTGVDCLAVSYGTKHGASKGINVTLRCEIVSAIRECLLHEGIFCALVSHGSSTVPSRLVEQINCLGGSVSGAGGVPLPEIHRAIASGIRKINVDTDIRLSVTRNLRELFLQQPELQKHPVLGQVYALMEKNPAEVDPRVFFSPVMQAILTGEAGSSEEQLFMEAVELGVKEITGSLLVEFGSSGMADAVSVCSLEKMADRYKKEESV